MVLPNIVKYVPTKKSDVCCRPGTRNVCNTAVCVCNVNVYYSCSTLAFYNRNYNVDVQNVSASSCGRPRTYSFFHDRVNGVKSSKTVRDLNVCEDVIKDLCSIFTNEPIQSIIPRKSVHKPVFSKHLSRASVSTSSVENNVSISLSRTSVCLDRSSSVFDKQKYCCLLGSFNIRIPLQTC